jgi:hypothetical protein
MSETHVISALRAKRDEVSGHIHDLVIAAFSEINN